LLAPLPKPEKRGKALFFSFSIVFRRSAVAVTSCRLMRRKPPDSPAGGAGAGAAAAAAAAVASGLAGAPLPAMSSSTLLCDFLRPVKRPSPGLPIVIVPVAREALSMPGVAACGYRM